MDSYLSLGAVAATILTLLGSIFMLLGAIFTLLGIIFTHLGTISTFLGSNFYKVYGKIRDQENKIIASLPSSPSLLRESPVMASSSLPLSPPSLLRENPLMASSSLPLSPPSLLRESPLKASSSSSLPLSTPYSPSLLCESPTMASSSLSLSSPSLLCESPIMDPSSLSLSLPSSSPPRSWEHDVFPSFHGPDVRTRFLSHIRKEFERHGITPFIDNEIDRGQTIGPELKRAIQQSKIAIVMLSKNYASSSWCLDELVEIMSKVVGQTVITIFYEVDPTDVKKQTGDFGKVFKETCLGKTKDKTETWRKALEGVATIAGYHYPSSNWIDEATMIENIAAYISKMLNRLAPSPDMDRLIGMGGHMERMQLLLRLDLDEVRMIGIWGPPGIGKSTIAKFLFHKLSNSFQFRAIMMDIKGNYPINCLNEGSAQLLLQTQLLSLIINHEADTMVTHLEVAPERLKDKNVFLVLDDVDRPAQLDALAREVQWFGPGSRIIITSEDLSLLKAHGINHIYKVDFPSDDEALQMFCMYAFGQKYPKDGFTELCHEITYLVGKLPLGLKVIGSYFRRMSKQEWIRALPILWSRLNGEIESILKFSYDALCDEEKDLFLHIACFFNHEEVEIAKEHLAKKFSNVKHRLQVLFEKSLISTVYSLSDTMRINMHNLLVQLGKEIVRKQSDRKPGKRQFLVDPKDIGEVFTDPTAITRSVIGIRCNRSYRNWDDLNISERAFERMSNLQFLKLDGNFGSSNIASVAGSLKYISPKLQLLDWENSSMTSLPFTTNLEFLVELRMPCSRLQKMWEDIKLLRNLKRMDLHYSRDLKEIPNLSTATKLEYLDLGGCSSLVELPSSLGNATNLQILNLENCSSLTKLHSSIGNATNLERLYLNGCSSLVELPSSIGNATNLQELDLSYCSSLVELPSYMGNLHRLTELNLEGCSKLEVLPTNINMKSLYELNLTNCSSFKSFPEISTNIKTLKLSGTAIEEVPPSIRSWSRLRDLQMSYCENLKDSAIDNITELHLSDPEIQEIGPWVKGCSRLKKVVLSGCRKLVSLPQLPDSINVLDVDNCDLLERLDCSFRKSNINSLKFFNCFKLNQEARDLISQTSARDYSVLPGREVPPCFTYRAYGNSVAMKLNEKPLRTSTKFKACILLGNKATPFGVGCIITSKQKALASCKSRVAWFPRNMSEHLYMFDFEAEEVTSSTELVFEFKQTSSKIDNWMIKECGILQLK